MEAQTRGQTTSISLASNGLLKVACRGFQIFVSFDKKRAEKTFSRIIKQFEEVGLQLTTEEKVELLRQYNTLLEGQLLQKENFSISQFSQFLNVFRPPPEKNFDDARRGILRYTADFCFVRPVFVKLKPPLINDNELVGLEKDFTVWELKQDPHAPPLFAIDMDGYINQNRTKLALESLQDPEVIKTLPGHVRKRIQKAAQEWYPVDFEEDLPPEVLAKLVFTPVPILRDPSFLKEEKPIKLPSGEYSWQEYVDKLVEWKKGKDPRLKLIHKSKLLRIPYLKYAPHSLEMTPPGVGKTYFYICSGHVVDKATPKSVLGFAKSPEEIYYGTAHNSELPIAFDQLESQTSAQLARYVFNLFEFGFATVDSGGVRFEVRTKSSFAYLGNPKVKEGRKDLSWLFIHLSTNPAIGRRFSWILFETDDKRMPAIKEKLTQVEEEEWRSAFSQFRAVEEFCLPKLKKIWNDKKVTNWINTPLEGYREAIENYVSNTQDPVLRGFLLSHAEAQHRVRAAALQIALVERLDKIALDSITIEELIEAAEEVLPEVININLESIKVMVEAWGQLTAESVNAWFNSLPEYLKHIASAIIHYIKANPERSSFSLNEIPYTDVGMEYLSKAVDRLKRSERGLSLLNYLSQFGITVKRDEAEFFVTYTNNKPLPPIRLLGRLLSKEEELTQEKKFSDTPSENAEKLRNLRNREKPEESLTPPPDGGSKGSNDQPSPTSPPKSHTQHAQHTQIEIPSEVKDKAKKLGFEEQYKGECAYCREVKTIVVEVNGNPCCPDCWLLLLKDYQEGPQNADLR